MSIGKLNIAELKDKLNKTKRKIQFKTLAEENPAEVHDWIPTGSTVLDYTICKGRKAGWPVGRISELAGEEGSGKSFLAAQAGINAQRKGYNFIYFESERALSSDFLAQMGCDLDNTLYVPAVSVEETLEIIEEILMNSEKNFFVWDSLAFTPAKTDIEGDYNPNSSIAVKARVLAKGFSKLIQPLSNRHSTLLVVNQLKVNIPSGPNAHIQAMMDPWRTPGGKSLDYVFSLRVWLTKRKSKKSFVLDESNRRIGTELKVENKKSRFGTEGRVCSFKILWGDYDRIGIMDEESWLNALKETEYLSYGAWCKLYDDNEKELYTFRSAEWEEKIKADDKFRARVEELLERELIEKFERKDVDVSSFYTLSEESE